MDCGLRFFSKLHQVDSERCSVHHVQQGLRTLGDKSGPALEEAGDDEAARHEPDNIQSSHL